SQKSVLKYQFWNIRLLPMLFPDHFVSFEGLTIKKMLVNRVQSLSEILPETFESGILTENSVSIFFSRTLAMLLAYFSGAVSARGSWYIFRVALGIRNRSSLQEVIFRIWAGYLV